MSAERERTIAFEMNYCQHYGRGKGSDMVCNAGMNLKEVQNVATGEKGIKWGPCIEGHRLSDPTAHCPHWIRRTREMGEKKADAIKDSMQRLALVAPAIAAWSERPPRGKQGVIECPACNGRLHLSQAASNGHIWAKCETPNCVRFAQ